MLRGGNTLARVANLKPFGAPQLGYGPKFDSAYRRGRL